MAITQQSAGASYTGPFEADGVTPLQPVQPAAPAAQTPAIAVDPVVATQAVNSIGNIFRQILQSGKQGNFIPGIALTPAAATGQVSTGPMGTSKVVS